MATTTCFTSDAAVAAAADDATLILSGCALSTTTRFATHTMGIAATMAAPATLLLATAALQSRLARPPRMGVSSSWAAWKALGTELLALAKASVATDERRFADAAPAEASAFAAVVVGKRKADAVGRTGTTPRSRVNAGVFDAPDVSAPFVVIVAFATSNAFVVVLVAVVVVVVVVGVCSLTITAA